MQRIVQLALVLTAMLPACCVAQTPAGSVALRIQKVDPPNWYATLPKPMLLIQGEGFTGATFSLSDESLRIECSTVSANGHWAQLWLTASPAVAETVQLSASRGALRASAAYTFAAPRAANDGMSGFSPADVMYLIMTDRFADGDTTNDGSLAHSNASSPEAAAERKKPRGWHGGDLRGIEQHIGYLKELGVTTVWPTPVYQNHGPEAYHGYHCTDYYSVDEHYGSLKDLQSLSHHLHEQGMKLVLDIVPNHVGPFHPWVKDPPAPDWFHGTLSSHTTATYDFGQLIDPHASRRERESVLDGWFVDLLPDMNTESPGVAQYLAQNAVWWIEETGADGLRIDTFAFVNRQFWADYTATLHALFPRLTEVGEIVNSDTRVTSFFAGGHSPVAADGSIDTGLTTPFDFPAFYALVPSLNGQKPMTALSDVLRDDALYPRPDLLVTLLGNHDQPRFLSQPGASAARLRMAYGLLATMRGIPQLYYGDEVMMTGGEDPDNRQDMPGGFSDRGPDAFAPASRTPGQASMHDWVQSLFALRRRSPALQTGMQEQIFVDKDTMAFVRQAKDAGSCDASPEAERFVVLLNASKAAKDVTLNTRATDLDGCHHYAVMLGAAASVADRGGDGDLRLKLPPESFTVFSATR